MTARRLARGALGVLGLLALGYAILLAWVLLNAERDTARQADTAIVLGAQALVAGRWNQCLVARVRQGATLLRAGVAQTLILSGGIDPEDGATEALVMRDIAISLGVKPANILLETRANSTAENLEFAQAIMAQHGLHSAIIVSDPYHLPRAALIAQKIRLEYSLSPARDSPCWTGFGRNVLREPIAIIDNWLRGRL